MVMKYKNLKQFSFPAKLGINPLYICH